MAASNSKKNAVALTTSALFSQIQDNLQLTWWAGGKNSKKGFVRLSFKSSELGLVGYFNLIHANQAQILGKTELNFFKQADESVLKNALSKLFKRQSAAIFISDNLKPPKIFKDYSNEYDLPIICSRLSSNELIDQLRYYLTQALAEKETLHGVFMEVISVGVLITGQSGLGKSELALDLVSRGHRLIADDAPEFARIAPDTINGTCPELLQNFLEVRGLGVLNIREMYGDSAIKTNKYLKLIIELFPHKATASKSEDRISLSEKKTNILGVNVSAISLPVAPGRNLAVMVEAAVRDHLLIKHGYNAGEDFVQRQKDAMQ
ncbi:MAG: HPr(Ser) kinase/phosphatase [Gammaproteobacteria bacterium]